MKPFTYLSHFSLLLGLLALSGCIKEKNQDCPGTGGHSLIVRSFDADDKEITGTGVVAEVVLYLYDAGGVFLGTIDCVENQRVPLAKTLGSPLVVVAWGNSRAGAQQMPTLAPGASLDQSRLTLLRETPQVQDAYSRSPDDLFYGKATIELGPVPGADEVVHPVFIKRKAASLSVEIKGLQEWAGTADTDFSLVINGVYESLDFSGTPTGNITSHRPTSSFDTQGVFKSGIIRTLPSGNAPVMIQIYRGSDLLYTLSTDQNGKPLVLTDGRLLNVLIDFNAGGKVSLQVSPWGKMGIDQEF